MSTTGNIFYDNNLVLYHLLSSNSSSVYYKKIILLKLNLMLYPHGKIIDLFINF